MQVRLQCAIKIVIFQLQLKKEIEKREIKKVKIGYDKVKIRCRIKNRLSSKV